MTKKSSAKTNWRERYEQTRKKIARLRKEVSLEDNPQYTVEVKETAKSITLTRETHSITFDKKRAMVTSAVADGVKLGSVMLPHLLAIDEKGRKISQHDSTKGDLKVRHEKFSIFLEGYFTFDGKQVPIVYEMDRMTGTTFCTMDVPGPLSVRRMTLEHGLGKTPRPLDTFYAPHHYLKRFKPYKPVVINEYEIDIIFEKDTIQVWTDGHIGFQVYSISWDKSRVLDTEKKFRYGTGEIRNNSSWIDLTFFSTGTKEAIDLPDGYRVTCAFNLMPFKKWRPKSEIFGSTYLMPPADGGFYKKGEEANATLSHFGRNGVTLACFGESHGCNDPVDPEYTKWFASTMQKNGVKPMLYIERSLTDIKRQPKVGMLTDEEILDGRQELISHFGPKNGGSPIWGNSSPMCCNYEPWRIHMLTMIDYHLAEMNVQGVYLDSSFICSCHNTRHGESPDENTSVRGSMIFQQDLRFILDDYQKKTGVEYPLINHYWDQHVAPHLQRQRLHNARRAGRIQDAAENDRRQQSVRLLRSTKRHEHDLVLQHVLRLHKPADIQRRCRLRRNHLALTLPRGSAAVSARRYRQTRPPRTAPRAVGPPRLETRPSLHGGIPEDLQRRRQGHPRHDLLQRRQHPCLRRQRRPEIEEDFILRQGAVVLETLLRPQHRRLRMDRGEAESRLHHRQGSRLLERPSGNRHFPVSHRPCSRVEGQRLQEHRIHDEER